MTVRLLMQNEVPVNSRGKVHSFLSTPDWKEVDSKIKKGIPDGQVLEVSFEPEEGVSPKNLTLVVKHHLRKLLVKHNKKYTVFTRRGIVYVSPS